MRACVLPPRCCTRYRQPYDLELQVTMSGMISSPALGTSRPGKCNNRGAVQYSTNRRNLLVSCLLVCLVVGSTKANAAHSKDQPAGVLEILQQVHTIILDKCTFSRDGIPAFKFEDTYVRNTPSVWPSSWLIGSWRRHCCRVSL